MESSGKFAAYMEKIVVIWESILTVASSANISVWVFLIAKRIRRSRVDLSPR